MEKVASFFLFVKKNGFSLTTADKQRFDEELFEWEWNWINEPKMDYETVAEKDSLVDFVHTLFGRYHDSVQKAFGRTID